MLWCSTKDWPRSKQRATGHLDIWVRPESGNADRVLAALEVFGAPQFDLTREDLLRHGTVFQIGVPPNRIDILTSTSGVSFDQAWPNRTTIQIESLAVPVLGKKEFIANKRALGRPRDFSDLDPLEEIGRA